MSSSRQPQQNLKPLVWEKKYRIIDVGKREDYYLARTYFGCYFIERCSNGKWYGKAKCEADWRERIKECFREAGCGN